MRKILEASDFTNGTYTGTFITEIVVRFLIKLTDMPKVNKIYYKNINKEGLEFVNSVIDELEIDFEIIEKELRRIPKKGAFITISNYPLGGLDALLLMKIISEIRPDYKFTTNYSFHKIKPLRELSIPVNQLEQDIKGTPSITSIKKALSHLNSGKPLGIFPAGRASTYHRGIKTVTDKKWNPKIIKFIKKTKVPVVPIYFQNINTIFYHILGNIHPLLQAARLQKEFFKKKKKTINIRIGNPIRINQQENFPDISMYGRFLRAKTYALGTTLEVNKFFNHKQIQKVKNVEEIIAPVNAQIIKQQIEEVRKNNLLFSISGFDIISAPANQMPDVLTELGRLREITFREVGEGTNKSSDIDEFDLYYHHLIIWDSAEDKIVGAIRVGKGKEILKQFGVSGFYINSLFKLKKEINPILMQSIELGRSFIVKEYQRKPLSLFLLWKGILYFLLKNTDYRYLIGPVSISNEFSKLSKNLIVEFFQKHFYNQQIAQFVEPRNNFKLTIDYNVDNELLLKDIGGNINKLDRYIKEIEPRFSMPVLLKKYMSMNAKIIAFNVDPKFNDCLDGLVIVDSFDAPIKMVHSLSKEINDDTILERFKIDKYQS